nr:uncharacterized protein LOC106678016 isoform X2 [Halyomorpha halys]
MRSTCETCGCNFTLHDAPYHYNGIRHFKNLRRAYKMDFNAKPFYNIKDEHDIKKEDNKEFLQMEEQFTLSQIKEERIQVRQLRKRGRRHVQESGKFLQKRRRGHYRIDKKRQSGRKWLKLGPPDAEMGFFTSLFPDICCLSPVQKRKIKIGVLQLIDEIAK